MVQSKNWEIEIFTTLLIIYDKKLILNFQTIKKNLNKKINKKRLF